MTSNASFPRRQINLTRLEQAPIEIDEIHSALSQTLGLGVICIICSALGLLTEAYCDQPSTCDRTGDKEAVVPSPRNIPY